MKDVLRRRCAARAWCFAALVATGTGLTVGCERWLEGRLLESKRAYETTARVVAKSEVQFTETYRSYVNDEGTRVWRDAGAREWRVYFEILSFDGLEGSLRESVARSETARLLERGPRFRLQGRELFERTTLGDDLKVTYRYVGHGRIEVISVVNPRFPALF